MNKYNDPVFVDNLLRLANATKAPDCNNECGDVVFTIEGWQVVIFYDCGELDYISHFVTTEGDAIDFWDWTESDQRDRLISWMGLEQ